MDDFSTASLFGILILLLVCGAWFSAAETGMMAINRHRLNHLIHKGNKSAKLTGRLLSKIDKLLGSILFGNTLLNVAAAAVTNIVIMRLFGASELALLIGTLLITFVLLVFSEIMPKIIAASYPERIALPSSYLLTPLITLFHPVVSVAGGIVKGVLWLLHIKVQTDQSKQKITLEELRGMVLEAEHFLPRKHQKMLLNLVDLERITVNDVMIPRNQIESLNINADQDTLREQIITCHHTLLPVYADTPGNILGILHIKRVPALFQEGNFNTTELRDVLQEPYFIPSDTPLLQQLQQFQERHTRMGLVVDEYGELRGLVTLENILEEIVGEFTTQSPSQTGKFLRQEDGSILLEGSTTLRELNRKLGLHLPMDSAKTLNGLILEQLEDIPETGTSLKIAGYPIEIIQTQDRIVKVARLFPKIKLSE
ncbi:MAG TPA: magnesium and cobalt efflux protein CorC [Gallionella sp.]|nr:CNNM domain-containing protein [Gallionella sp.]OGS66339.1 MAG: magnesium and cobalt efflux protein CorC [Gallionellales bacterium GWA2_54_124]OGT19228.1 MAG: magnesium and cobalt efflux protein CorC [Gallionellales bacterium RIFOXYD12_FULL_53_10]HCI52701.1 magnesium and cobalt efflux protein CorC [Gallionella sp.]